MDLANESGAKCAYSECRLYEYMPFKCDKCGKQYCCDHFQPSKHDCPVARQGNVVVPVCPLCGKTISYQRGEDPNRNVDIHIQSGCVSHVQQGATWSVPQTKPKASVGCAVSGCKNGMVVSQVCKQCGLKLCLPHRLEPDHNCRGAAAARLSSRQQMAEARVARFSAGAAATAPPPSAPAKQRAEPVASTSAAASSSARPSAAPRSKAFFNTRSSAIGDETIPPSDRLHLVVLMPASTEVQHTHMYFPRRMTVERATEAIAAMVQLPLQSASQRLSLFQKSGQRLPQQRRGQPTHSLFPLHTLLSLRLCCTNARY